ncbi:MULTISPECIES: RusA family crossover junction endodeoxyribonuclease [unclassified Stenotrophomonas]|uniref:RusA family crossover junction endodeoxyribonuclease n=1 Tax=unclassified Stenotrophomonas TaxID=196198 RepID=UPI003012EE3E
MSVLVLPLPPSLNKYWRNVAGKTLISAHGRAYRQHVGYAAIGAKGFGAGQVRVCIEAWVPDNRRRDLDNMLKAPLDALAHAGVYADDSQIIDLHIRRAGIDKTNPRLEITLEAA